MRSEQFFAKLPADSFTPREELLMAELHSDSAHVSSTGKLR